MNPLVFSFALLLPVADAPPPSYRAERIALVSAAIADTVTTRMAIQNGGREGNGLLARVIGPRPSTLALVGVKLAAIGLIEASTAHLRRKGKHGLARFNYWIATLAWAWASGWNLQWSR